MQSRPARRRFRIGPWLTLGAMLLVLALGWACANQPLGSSGGSNAAMPGITSTPVSGQPPKGAVAARVTYVVDGDTIHVDVAGQEFKVRYLLIDTPEVDEPYYEAATDANRRLVGDKTVYLAKDVSETDRYGRALRYIYLGDGTFVNEALVREGWAVVTTFPPDVAQERILRRAERDARAARRGMWATP